MPIQSIQVCQNSGFMTEVRIRSHSDPEMSYGVIVQAPDDPPSEAVCECEGFRYRGQCSHQQEAVDSICGWSSFTSDVAQSREQRRDKTCPRCGGPTDRLLIEVPNGEA